MPDPAARRIPRDKWPKIPPAPETRLATGPERDEANRVFARLTTVSLPTTVEGLTLGHLPEADEQDYALALLALKVGTMRSHPDDTDVILFHALAPGLGNDELPGWVVGVGTIVSALAQAARQQFFRREFERKLAQMGMDLKRAPRDLIAQVDEAATRAATEEQDTEDNGGGPYTQITRRKLARRRRIALGLPFDPKAARKDAKALATLHDIVREYLDSMVATEERRARRRQREQRADQTG